MNEASPLDNAKNKIEEAIKELEASNKQALLQAVEDVFTGENKDKEGAGQERVKRYWWPFAVVTIGIPGLALALSVFVPPSVLETQGLMVRTLLMFLAFVVALATYLASVAREAVKTLSTGKAKNPVLLKKNIFWMATAEVPLVVIGVLLILRLFTGPFTVNMLLVEKAFSFDAFLMSFLALILVWLAVLHLRIWMITKPWQIYE